MKNIIYVLMFSVLLFGNSLEEIKQKGEIRVGVWKDQAPFSSLDNGEFIGFEVDMANMLSKKIFGDGILVKFVGIDNTNQRISFLEDDKVDLVIASFTKTKERALRVDFGMPYFSVAQGVLTKKNIRINKSADLADKRVVIQENSSGQNYFKDRHDIEKIFVESTGEGYRLLKDGKADAYINDNLIVMTYPIVDDNFIVAETMRNLGRSDYLCPAVKKGNDELRKAVDKYMIELSKEGFFQKIYNDTFAPFYRNTADPKYFLLEDLYRIYG